MLCCTWTVYRSNLPRPLTFGISVRAGRRGEIAGPGDCNDLSVRYGQPSSIPQMSDFSPDLEESALFSRRSGCRAGCFLAKKVSLETTSAVADFLPHR